MKEKLYIVTCRDSEAERVDRIKDDKVVCYLNNRATWHVSCDRACTRIEVTQLSVVCGRRWRTLDWHTAYEEDEVVIQEDQDGDLGL